MRLRRALFVSGSLGKGHDAVAEACAGALEPFGVESRLVDGMALLGRGSAAAGEWVFRRLLSVPAVYDAFHFSQLRGDGRLGRAAERAAVAKMVPALGAEMARFDPELVVPVFATGAAATARLKMAGLKAAGLKAGGRPPVSVVVMTDSFAHRMWVHEPTDLFLVTSALAAESVRRYWPEARVEVITAPVLPEFHRAPSRQAARSRLGVPAGARCALLMSGAWGLGPLDGAAAALAGEGVWVLAVAGTNAAMERSLRALAGWHREVIPFGYTERVPELMSACDVVVTSSGDTCREARALGRGIVLMDVVPGHGRENFLHELEVGGATACMPEAGSIARSVRSFLADERRSQGRPVAGAGAGEADFVAALRRLGFDLEG
ncbi:MAG: glycosyltransferase family protein [Acidimicrobiales bacterium]